MHYRCAYYIRQTSRDVEQFARFKPNWPNRRTRLDSITFNVLLLNGLSGSELNNALETRNACAPDKIENWHEIALHFT
jgi:hypothetical protein